MDASAGEWIAPLLGQWGTVGAVVGEAFAAYAVVPHGERVPGEAPGEVLDDVAAAALRTVIGPEPGPCVAALWDGYGGLFGGAVGIDLDTGRQSPVLPAFPPEIERLPRLQLPFRGYLLFAADIEELGDLRLPHHYFGRSPSLFWPISREWLIGGDTDLVATFVGGPEWLIERVLEQVPGASRAEPADPLSPWDERTLQQGL